MFRSSREGPTEGKAGGRTSIWLGTALIAAVGLLLGPLALALLGRNHATCDDARCGHLRPGDTLPHR